MNEPEAITIQVSSLEECLDTCISNFTCRAFNTKQAGGAVDCQLLTRDRNSHPGDVVAASGWNYYYTGLYKTQVRTQALGAKKCENKLLLQCFPFSSTFDLLRTCSVKTRLWRLKRGPCAKIVCQKTLRKLKRYWKMESTVPVIFPSFSYIFLMPLVRTAT